jgi:VIT1/CCC1 family predicted Fe2+/Mn2+ transporter
MARRHTERHRTDRIGWLRAAVLGANDGIVSTASLLVGVAAASASHDNILVTGVAGLVAGAMSMAAGEYVSVHSQADTEAADLARESAELKADPAAEMRELTAIYVSRGLDATLAGQVAAQLMAHDPLGAHARDELGISTAFSAQPVQAALASAASFAVGAALPLASPPWCRPRWPDHRGFGHVAGLSGRAGAGGCARWGRAAGGGRLAGHVLGRFGDGDHGRGRRTLRRRGVDRP